MSDKTEQVTQEMPHQIETALAGVDRPVVFAPSSASQRAKTPPRRRWPKPSVVRKRKKGFGDWVFSFVFTPVYYVTDPIGTVYDWLVGKLSFFRQKRALRGGWRSTAGALLAAHKAFSVRRFLVAGSTGLHLVYIGELGPEVGWSVPREQVRGVEHLEWAGGMPGKATIRFHFADGSWGDLVVIGETWQQMLSQFPAVRSK